MFTILIPIERMIQLKLALIFMSSHSVYIILYGVIDDLYRKETPLFFKIESLFFMRSIRISTAYGTDESGYKK